MQLLLKPLIVDGRITSPPSPSPRNRSIDLGHGQKDKVILRVVAASNQTQAPLVHVRQGFPINENIKDGKVGPVESYPGQDNLLNENIAVRNLQFASCCQEEGAQVAAGRVLDGHHNSLGL